MSIYTGGCYHVPVCVSAPSYTGSGQRSHADALRHHANTFVNYLKDINGSDYRNYGYSDSQLKDMAEKGSFFSKKLNKEVRAPSEVQEAAKFLVKHGGLAAFDLDNNGLLGSNEFESYGEDPNGKQARLSHSAHVLAEGMKQVYGDGYKDRSWGADTLKDIADDGVFYSPHYKKHFRVSPEAQHAAKEILANGGSTVFDREGNAKDGIFTFDDLKHYLNAHPDNPLSTPDNGHSRHGHQHGPAIVVIKI